MDCEDLREPNKNIVAHKYYCFGCDKYFELKEIEKVERPKMVEEKVVKFPVCKKGVSLGITTEPFPTSKQSSNNKELGVGEKDGN